MSKNLHILPDLFQDFHHTAEHQADSIRRVALLEKIIAIRITLQHHAGHEAFLALGRKTFPELIRSSVHVFVLSRLLESVLGPYHAPVSRLSKLWHRNPLNKNQAVRCLDGKLAQSIRRRTCP